MGNWKYMNGSQAQASTTSVNTSYKERFKKLLDFHIRHKAVSVESHQIQTLDDNSFFYTEHHNDGYDLGVVVHLLPTFDEAWRVRIFEDHKLTNDIKGDGYSELLKELKNFLHIPTVGTPEYNNLLTEWVEMKNNNSSGSYKKRFEKLIKYHIDHASSELESITKKDIRDNYFRLSEHYNTGLSEFDRDIVVSYDKDSDTFFLRIFVDNKEVYSKLCNSYKEFVEAAEGYMFLPDSGTKEYDDLLAESYFSIADDFKTYENLWN